jgi:DNA-binding transcriptional regulator GbsR (MarR family)
MSKSDPISSDSPAGKEAEPTRPNGSPSSYNQETLSDRHTDAVDRFVRFWGEMASTWGINRTMAQIHALLYCTEAPLNTDDIMERLDISRGNANMNLRSLTDWNLVQKTQRPHSRKDFYVAEKDVWQITTRIIQERERRELHPVKDQLRECADLLVEDGEPLDDRPEADRVLHRRLGNLIELMEVFQGFSEALLPLVQKRNVSTIRHLINVVRSLDDTSTPDA